MWCKICKWLKLGIYAYCIGFPVTIRSSQIYLLTLSNQGDLIMIGVDQVVVALWFLPVVSFIILPLFVACFGLLYSMFGAFKPVAGQIQGLQHRFQLWLAITNPVAMSCRGVPAKQIWFHSVGSLFPAEFSLVFYNGISKKHKQGSNRVLATNN